MKYSLLLTLVLAGLGKLPLEQSFLTWNELQKQINEQNERIGKTMET